MLHYDQQPDDGKRFCVRSLLDSRQGLQMLTLGQVSVVFVSGVLTRMEMARFHNTESREKK